MSKFTEGPWEARFFQGVRLEVRPVDWDRPIVCEVHQPGRGGEEAIANARLIAAAPELAEALADLVWAVNNGLDPKRALESAYAAQEKAGVI